MVRLRRARDIVSSNRMTTGFHPAVGMATMSGMRHDDMVGVSRAIRIGVLDNDPFALERDVRDDLGRFQGLPRHVEHWALPRWRLSIATTRIPGRRCWCWIWHWAGSDGRTCAGASGAGPVDRHRVRHLVFRGRLPAGGDRVRRSGTVREGTTEDRYRRGDTLGGSRPSRRRTGRCGFS